jgi:hypothetical protein
MTPELKIACEVVFQEHKTSAQIKWDRDAFRGKISIGLSEMAKETLVKKNIIFWPNKSKKIITLLNPDVATATSVEEAEEIMEHKTPELANSVEYDPESYIAGHVLGFDEPPVKPTVQPATITVNAEPRSSGTQWYMKPVFYYLVWPVFAIAAGALLSYLLVLAQSKLFLHLK